MTKWTVLPRSGAANESLPALPRAHAHDVGTHRVKNILRCGRRAMVGFEKNELSDWKEWVSSDKVRSRTKAFFNPLYRRIAAKRIGVAVMTANNSIRGRRSSLRRGTRRTAVRKGRFTDAERDLLFYKKLLKELNKRRKREMQDGAETPCSDEWRQVMERLGPMDACGAIKNLNETVLRKVIHADPTWFSVLGKQLEKVGKKCVLKGKPAAEAVDDDEGEDLDLPVLSPAMVEEVAAALEPEPASEVLVSGFRLNISRSDIGTLNDDRWLNDEIINFYLSVIMERSGTEEAREKAWPRVYAFNTFFFPKLAVGGYAAVKRWTRSVDLFSFDILLVPLHCTMHWCLAAVDFRKRTISYYDSLKSQGDKHHFLLRLQSYIEDESQGKKNKGIDWDAWALIDVEEVPQQTNTNDCGVFICQYSECLSRDAPMEFGQEHMPYFRERMTYEVLHKTILSA